MENGLRLAFLHPATASIDGAGDHRQLLAVDAELVILPELYFRANHPACPSDGPLPSGLRADCQQAGRALMFGYEEACSGETFNAVQVIDDRGIALANYRCTHPAEKGHGIGRWLTIVALGTERVGVLAGDDLLASEVWRALALSEASCILWSGLAHTDSAWVLRTRALENGVSVAGVDANGVYAFGSKGEIMDCRPGGRTVQVTLETKHQVGPPLKRQPILYRRLVSDAA